MGSLGNVLQTADEKEGVSCGAGRAEAKLGSTKERVQGRLKVGQHQCGHHLVEKLKERNGAVVVKRSIRISALDNYLARDNHPQV